MTDGGRGRGGVACLDGCGRRRMSMGISKNSGDGQEGVSEKRCDARAEGEEKAQTLHGKVANDVHVAESRL